MNSMNRKRYSFVMLDRIGFERYEKSCKRAGVKCNYHQINADTYGVMVADERDEDVKIVEKKEMNMKNNKILRQTI